MIRQLHLISVLAIAVVAGGCISKPPDHAATMRQRLEREADHIVSDRNVDREIDFDSAASRAVPGLVYYTAHFTGFHRHDTHLVATARLGDRFFEPENLEEWGPVFTSWQPRNAEAALTICLEVLATGVNNDANLLTYRNFFEFLLLDSALVHVYPHDQLVERALGDLTIDAPKSGSDSMWTVRLWYPDLNVEPHPNRLTTKYVCRIPSAPANGRLQVSQADSILGGYPARR